MLSKFSWDPAKARANARKHGVTFEEAVEAFEDPLALEEVDSDLAYDETRFKLLGRARNRILVVIYTEREMSARVISARKATSHEQSRYFATKAGR